MIGRDVMKPGNRPNKSWIVDTDFVDCLCFAQLLATYCCNQVFFMVRSDFQQ